MTVMQHIINILKDLTANLWGGTPSGSGATAIEFSNSWLGKLVQAITSNDLLLLFCVLSLVGLAVGVFSRICRAN